jgi:hypothetical protein
MPCDANGVGNDTDGRSDTDGRNVIDGKSDIDVRFANGVAKSCDSEMYINPS